MEHSVLDLPALFVAILVSIIITGVLIVAHGDYNKRRGWIAAGLLAAALIAIGLFDLLRQQPRETHLATVFLGATLPIVGAIGVIRGTKRVTRRWIRWPVIFLATFILLFVGLLFGATIVPRYLSG
jgi:hypothetical protein